MVTSNILLETGTNELELVEFYIDEIHEETGETSRNFYGMNVAKVLEIVRMPSGVAPMPDLPTPAVLGAFDQRGRLIPLIDLAIWLNKQTVENYDPRVIICEFNRNTTAFMVCGVTRIHRLRWDEIDPPEPHVAAMTNNNITGVVRMHDHLMLVLDMEKIVGDINPDSRMHLVETDWVRDMELDKTYRAIIADDSAAIRNTMCTVLEQAGFLVTKTSNGQEAWDKMLSIKKRMAKEERELTAYVDVVVTDIEMPAMDGHTLCKNIKEDAQLRHVPVLLFSSLITDKLTHKGESVGADAQISKPEIGKVAEKAYELIKHYQDLATERAESHA
ncbi:MAG: chemotaxis protein [Proteobacteria bacterium]|nr:chemotaxis protein [Pseudomonadota bacterium]